MMSVRLAHMTKPTFFLIAAMLILSGCATPNTIGTVKEELLKGGFALVYPAQEGIEPGQIWSRNMTQLDQRRPEALKDGQSGNVQFESIKTSVDAGATLDMEFGGTAAVNSSELAVGLKLASVKNVNLDFGETSIKRIVIGDLRDDAIRKNLPAGYVEALSKVQNENGSLSVITGVLYAKGMTYTFDFDNKSNFNAAIPRLEIIIKSAADIHYVSNTKAVWKISGDKPLAIGISPLSGKLLELSPEVQTKVIQQLFDEAKKARLMQLNQVLQSVPGNNNTVIENSGTLSTIDKSVRAGNNSIAIGADAKITGNIINGISNPWEENLTAASAAISIRVKLADPSKKLDDIPGTWNNGGSEAFIAFVKNGVPTIKSTAPTLKGGSGGAGVSIYSAVTQMSPADAPTSYPIKSLLDNDYIYVEMYDFPEKCEVIGGEIVWVLNNSRVSFTIPSQISGGANGKVIVIPNISLIIRDAIEKSKTKQ
jgi:hypothetical protein